MACHPPVFTLLAHPRSTLTILPFIKSLQMATSHSPTPCHLEYWNTSTTTTTYTHSHTLLFKHLSENETQPGPCTPTDSVFWNLTPFHPTRPLQVSFTLVAPVPRTPVSRRRQTWPNAAISPSLLAHQPAITRHFYILFLFRKVSPKNVNSTTLCTKPHSGHKPNLYWPECCIIL